MNRKTKMLVHSFFLQNSCLRLFQPEQARRIDQILQTFEQKQKVICCGVLNTRVFLSQKILFFLFKAYYQLNEGTYIYLIWKMRVDVVEALQHQWTLMDVVNECLNLLSTNVQHKNWIFLLLRQIWFAWNLPQIFNFSLNHIKICTFLSPNVWHKRNTLSFTASL